MIRLFISVIFLLVSAKVSFSQEFIEVQEGQFYHNGQPYKFLGANLWYGMHLGMNANEGDKARLIRELDQLKSLGVNNLRILGSTEGQGEYQIQPALLNASGNFNEELFRGLDFLLDEMRKRDMTAVVILNNFWMWSGGMAQYVSWVEGSEIPYPDIENGGSWDSFINYSLKFYKNRRAQRNFRRFIRNIVNRENTYSGVKYKNDPTILSWQLANEPRAYSMQKEYRDWISRTASYLNRKDRNHMISLGAEGNTNSNLAGIDLYLDNQFKSIDYATVHIWIQNWGWYDPNSPITFKESIKEATSYLDGQLKKAQRLNKPIVIEEFGVSRDNGSCDKASTTEIRDQFYQFIFDITHKNILDSGPIQGCNFWSWGGEGRPEVPGKYWTKGNELIGDPPHEKQGWYSVYNTDSSTLNIIKQSGNRINSLNQ